jgi:hypothetical protein
MKKIYLVIILGFIGLSGFGQGWEWAKGFDYIGGLKISTDKDENIYLYGQQSDNIIRKESKTGNVIWEIKYANKFPFCDIKKLVCDKDGDIYVTGNFSDSITIQNTKLISNGNYDIYFAKFNSDGTLVWLKQIGGKESDYAGDIFVDNDQNIFLTGSVKDLIKVANETIYSDSSGTFFLEKLNPANEVEFIKFGHITIENPNSSSSGEFVKCDSEGNIILIISMVGTIQIDSIRFEPPDYDAFYAIKFNSNGQIEWNTEVSYGGYYCTLTDFEIDENDNIIVVAGYLTPHTNDNKIIKVSRQGNKLWETNENQLGLISDLKTKKNNIVITSNRNSGYSDPVIFTSELMELNENGEKLWEEKIEGENYKNFSSIDITNTGYLITGSFYDSLLLDTIQLDNPYHQNFIAKYSLGGFLKTTENVFSENVNIYPNPSQGKFTIQSFLKSNICIYNVLGKCILIYQNLDPNIQIDLNSKPKGIYFIEINNEKKKEVHKVIIN